MGQLRRRCAGASLCTVAWHMARAQARVGPGAPHAALRGVAGARAGRWRPPPFCVVPWFGSATAFDGNAKSTYPAPDRSQIGPLLSR